jgi:hypothetical protein
MTFFVALMTAIVTATLPMKTSRRSFALANMSDTFAAPHGWCRNSHEMMSG